MAGNHMSEMSPRQRMINMMYLVLTALLAMNISKEVLEAFKTMDKSIEYSYTDKQEFTKKQYKDFQNKADNNPDKLGEWNNVAIQLKYESQELIKVLDSIKSKFGELSGFEDDLPEGMLKQKDNKELVIKILIKSESKDGLGYGIKLKEAREKYKDFLLSLDSLEIYEGEGQVKDTLERQEARERL
jgi:gliding motility-associated protein GldM